MYLQPLWRLRLFLFKNVYDIDIDIDTDIVIDIVIGQHSNRIGWKKRQIRAITPFKVIQGHRGGYQSKARVRLSISD